MFIYSVLNRQWIDSRLLVEPELTYPLLTNGFFKRENKINILIVYDIFKKLHILFSVNFGILYLIVPIVKPCKVRLRNGYIDKNVSTLTYTYIFIEVYKTYIVLYLYKGTVIFDIWIKHYWCNLLTVHGSK